MAQNLTEVATESRRKIGRPAAAREADEYADAHDAIEKLLTQCSLLEWQAAQTKRAVDRVLRATRADAKMRATPFATFRERRDAENELQRAQQAMSEAHQRLIAAAHDM